MSMIQEGHKALWRLQFGELLGGLFRSPEEAVFALANLTARLPAGLKAQDWVAPTGLGGWKQELVPDPPPREGQDEW